MEMLKAISIIFKIISLFIWIYNSYKVSEYYEKWDTHNMIYCWIQQIIFYMIVIA